MKNDRSIILIGVIGNGSHALIAAGLIILVSSILLAAMMVSISKWFWFYYCVSRFHYLIHWFIGVWSITAD